MCFPVSRELLIRHMLLQSELRTNNEGTVNVAGRNRFRNTLLSFLVANNQSYESLIELCRASTVLPEGKT